MMFKNTRLRIFFLDVLITQLFKTDISLKFKFIQNTQFNFILLHQFDT